MQILNAVLLQENINTSAFNKLNENLNKYHNSAD